MSHGERLSTLSRKQPPKNRHTHTHNGPKLSIDTICSKHTAGQHLRTSLLCLSVSLFLCSEKPLSLQILLTDRQSDQSADSQDQQAPPLSPCLVKPLHPQTNSVSDCGSGAGAHTGSPRDYSMTGGPCFVFGKPLTNTRSLPALCVDNLEENHLGDLAPPPQSKEAELPPQRTITAPICIPVKAPPPPRQPSQTSSPVGTDDRGHLTMSEAPHSTRNPHCKPPPACPRVAPLPSSYPVRNWSCLYLDPHDVVDSPVDPPISSPLYSTLNSNSNVLPLSAVSWPAPPSSPPPSQDHIAALPVERWAENVNRYYGSQNATGGGGEDVPCEELSELDSLYQASLLAPSMHRGSRGVSPQPANNKPGSYCRYTSSIFQVILMLLNDAKLPSTIHSPLQGDQCPCEMCSYRIKLFRICVVLLQHTLLLLVLYTVNDHLCVRVF